MVCNVLGVPVFDLTEAVFHELLGQIVLVENRVMNVQMMPLPPHERLLYSVYVMMACLIYPDYSVEVRNGQSQDTAGLNYPSPLPQSLSEGMRGNMFQNMARVHQICEVVGEDRQVRHFANIVDVLHVTAVDIDVPWGINLTTAKVN